jgi:hypothetical protein
MVRLSRLPLAGILSLIAVSPAFASSVHATSVHASSRTIPAFARKYGLKCTACHEAWPVLNVVGRAFRDNGYRFNNGKDDAITTDPSYWPIFAWLQQNYQYQYNKSENHTLVNSGSVTGGSAVVGAMGSLSKNISFKVIPVVEFNGAFFFEQGWIRINRLFDTDALNVRIGAIEFDLPIATAGERDFTFSGGAQRSLSYSVPGSANTLDLLGAPPGIEISGHDRGSINRYAVLFYNNTGAGGHHTLFNTPSAYGHVSHLFQVPGGFVRDVEIGAFGTYATVNVGPDTAALKSQQRYGASLDTWLASDALPLHLEALYFHGKDDKAIIAGATRDAIFNGGLVQVDYVPALPFEIFARYNLVRNTAQPVVTQAGSFADQSIYLIGIQHTVEFTSRFEWGWQLNYSLQQNRFRAPDGSNLTQHLVWAGLTLAF